MEPVSQRDGIAVESGIFAVIAIDVVRPIAVTTEQLDLAVLRVRWGNCSQTDDQS
jgi:hypothetical protein